MKKIIFILTFLFVAVFGYSQNTSPYGNYHVRSFKSIEFKAPGQMFCVIQGPKKDMFFGNDYGILRYNGEDWSIIKLKNKIEQKCFSLHIDSDDNIYYGGDSEIGYLELDEEGVYQTILIANEESDSAFGNVKAIVSTRSNVYFKHDSGYFVYNKVDKDLKHVELGKDVIVNSLMINGSSLIGQTRRLTEDSVFYQVISFTASSVSPISEEVGYLLSDNFKKGVLTKFIRVGGEDLLIYSDGQVRKYDSKAKKIKSTSFKLSSLITEVDYVLFQNDHLWISGENSGISLLNSDGEYIRGWKVETGLSSNKINNMAFDSDNNLWLANVVGADILELSSPSSFYSAETNFKKSVEALSYYNDNLYLGGFEGLTYLSGDTTFLSFDLKVDKNDVFDILSFKDVQLVVGYDGISEIKNGEIKQINTFYAWKLYRSEKNPNSVYVGLDKDGLGMMIRDDAGNWTSTVLKGTSGIVRSIKEFNGEVYYTVQNKGVYKLDTNKTQDENLIKSEFYEEDADAFILEEFNGELIIGSTTGLYRLHNNEVVKYDVEDDRFSEDKLYIHRLYNDQKGKLWIILFRNYETGTEIREVGYLELDNGSFNFVSEPFKEFTRSTIHSIYRQGKYVWFGATEGLYSYNLEMEHSFEKSYEVQLSYFQNISDPSSFDTILYDYSVYKNLTSAIELPYKDNKVRLEISSPQYFGGVTNKYRFLLEGHETAWSKWDSRNYIEYSKLRHGTYTLKFQARNYYGNESDIKEIQFTILPPWYFTWWAYVLYFIGAIFIIVLVARLSVNRVKQQKIHLEEVVKERTSEIAEQNNQLEHQKAEITEKSNDILDSIKYAERIQQTILPSDEFMEEMFEEHFVLFKPKDIVSGDFYWAAVSKKMFLFSAIDCTGHGVPGAFVSIVGHNGLTRAIKEFGHSKPSDILDTLREIVIDAFKGQGKADVKDGMDVALCGIDYENMILHFAGAHNPCIIIRDGEIIEIKADKQPIGQFEYGKPFTAHEFDLKKGDVIYTYTDGYIDQFGGVKGKKFKSRPFKNLLLEIVHLPLEEQKQILNTRFIEWCGEHEQIDDVCVFGVKI